MRSGKVRPLYTELGGAERFALELAAAARGDDAEADHLEKGCPLVKAEVPDLDYGRAHDRAVMLAARFGMPAHRFLGWLDLLETLEQAIITGFGGEPPSEHSPSGATLRLYRGARAIAASNLRSLLDALEEVCRTRMGVEGAAILGNYDPTIPEALGRYEVAIGVEDPDPALIQSYVAYLEVPFTCWDEAPALRSIPDPRGRRVRTRAL